MKNNVTLTDIAEALNVSIATVHRALTGKGRINLATKQMILAKAEELGYKNIYAPNPDRETNIAFICPDNFFYQEIIKGAQASSNEYKELGLKITFLLSDDYSPQKQIDELNKIIDGENFDGIVISPTHTMLLNPLLDSLHEKNIPAVTVNNDISESGRLCFVGEDSYSSGQMSAQLYSSIMKEHSKIALMKSLVSAEGLRQRIEGFSAFVESDKRLGMLGVYDFYDNINDAYETAKLIMQNTEAEGIFTNSMIGTIGTLRAIKELKLDNPPFMIGYDLNDEIKQGIEAGLLFGTMFQSPYRQGYYSVKVLYNIILNDGKQFNGGLFNIPTFLIMKSNLESVSHNFSILLD